VPPDWIELLVNVETKEEQGFFHELHRRVAESERNDAFVFVHGFNVKRDEPTITLEELERRMGLQKLK
jgi:esterase/lipase superfamily enzyme